MTPPAAAALLDAAARDLPRQRRPRPVVAARPDWACENCATHNPGRRRRCVDCGTSRV